MDDQEILEQTEDKDDVVYQSYFDSPGDEPPGQQSLWEITETTPPQYY